MLGLPRPSKSYHCPLNSLWTGAPIRVMLERVGD